MVNVIKIYVEKSTTGGSQFTPDFSIVVDQIGTKVGSIYRIKNQQIRADSYPRLAVDRSPNPSTSGTLYVVWANKASGRTDADIKMAKRTPSGTWTISNLATATVDEWAPAIWVGPDGVRHVLWYEGAANSDEIKVRMRSYSADGLQTLVDNFVGVVPAFQINSSYQEFLGDYFGVAGWYEKAFGAWVEARQLVGGHSNTQVYFKQEGFAQQPIPSGYVRTTVTQVDQADVAFGKFGRWRPNQFVNYAAPHDFVWPYPSTEILRASQNFRPDGTEKYNNWLSVADVVNHRSFDVLSSTTLLKSRFKTAYNATIRTELIDGGSGGDVEFRDPWLIDYNDPAYGNNARNRGQDSALWYSHRSPFSPNTNTNYKGVFLNQTVASGNYYSARVPQSQPLNGFTWYFQNWSASGANPTQPSNVETPVVFTAANAEVKARYKAHRGSNSTLATAYNNQRKMVWEGTNYHMVYESAGDIWYTTTTGSDNAWTPEVRLSDGSGANKYPSIDVLNQIVIVVWQQELSGSGKICMRRKYNGVWQPEQEVATFLASSGFIATPVVCALGTFYYLVVWHDYNNPGLRIRAFNEGNDSLGTATAIPGTNTNSFYPTISKDTYEFCHLGWAESGTIYYSKISFDGSSYTFSPSKENVSSGTYDSGHTYPSITTDYSRRPNIAWQTGAEQVIIQRRRELSGAWGTANIFIGSDLYNTPSITGYPNVPNNNNLAIVWRRDPTTTRLARYVNAAWSEYTQSSGGYHPNLSATMSGGTAASKFVVRGSTAPYTITTSSENLPKANPLKVAQYRRGVFVIGDKEIAYDLGEIFYRDQFAEKAAALFPYVDTLVVGLTAS